MNIKQALKRKNKLVVLIQQEYAKMISYNSYEAGTVRPYSAVEAMGKWNGYINELIDLKTAIHRANRPVYDKIFRLSELKSQVKQLRSLNCTEGKERNMYSRETEPILKTAEIGLLKRDEMVSVMEAEIEDIQEKLDVYNAITEI